MATRSWTHRLLTRTLRRNRKAKAPVSGRDRGSRPRLEWLEDRTLLSLTLSPIAPPLLTDNAVPYAIAVGDLTGNGLPDVVDVDASAIHGNGFANANVDVFDNFSDAIVTGFGAGHGVVPTVDVAAGDGTQVFAGTDVALGDFDGRHYANGLPILDMAVACKTVPGDGHWVSILMNTGPAPTFASPTLYNDGATDVTVGDFTGNGRDDLFLSGGFSNAGTPELMLSNADGTFQNFIDLGGDAAGKAVVGDFDGRHYANGLPILDVAAKAVASLGL